MDAETRPVLKEVAREALPATGIGWVTFTWSYRTWSSWTTYGSWTVPAGQYRTVNRSNASWDFDIKSDVTNVVPDAYHASGAGWGA